MTRHQRVLISTKCGCGKHKNLGYSFCGSCFFSLPAELQDKIRTKDKVTRDEAYEAAYLVLQPMWPTGDVLRELTLSEDQLTGIFLGADIEGKRIAVQALLDWAR